MESVATAVHREPWNKGKIVGQKAPFKLTVNVGSRSSKPLAGFRSISRRFVKTNRPVVLGAVPSRSRIRRDWGS
jgi:hypothetical protein